MDVRAFAFGVWGSFGGSCGCGFFYGEGMCGFGGWEVVGGLVLGLISFVLVWHCDAEALVFL